MKSGLLPPDDSVRFKDESGDPYGIKEVDGKPRFSSTPYQVDIVEGNLAGHFSLNKFGFNPAVPATLETVWDASVVYTWATTDTVISTAAGATDLGVQRSTGTATSGTVSELDDTGVDFTVGPLAVVGDLLVNDTNTEHGIITVVAATKLTICSVMGVANAAGDTYRVVRSNGVGAAAIKIYGNDVDYNEIEEYTILNGAAPVVTIKVFHRVWRAKVILAGASGSNAANVLMTINGVLSAQITALLNQTQMALWTVPAGYTAYLSSFFAASSVANKVVNVYLFVRPCGQVFQLKNRIIINAGTSLRGYDFPVVIPGKSDIEIRAQAAVGAGEVAAGFDLWYES